MIIKHPHATIPLTLLRTGADPGDHAIVDPEDLAKALAYGHWKLMSNGTVAALFADHLVMLDKLICSVHLTVPGVVDLHHRNSNLRDCRKSNLVIMGPRAPIVWYDSCLRLWATRHAGTHESFIHALTEERGAV